MKQTNRRVFMMQVALGSTALAAQQAMAQAMVNEKDPQSAALGYAADTTKVDAKKFPKHAAAQKCNNCALYQGKATDPAGGCPLIYRQTSSRQRLVLCLGQEGLMLFQRVHSHCQR